jgi:putative hydrolase of HD superfamily
MKQRLLKQVEFLVEIDKLKTILRQTNLIHRERRENDAEHSWHLALAALVLAEHANEPVDLAKVIAMVLVHDLVEIDAGDTFCYDYEGYKDKAQREELAAERIFALLPEDQGRELRALWEEFEERATPEARFATALDRFQPVLHNLHTDGGTWRRYNITRPQVEERNAPMAEGSQLLWEYRSSCLDEAVVKGMLSEGRDE